MTMHTRVGYHQ